MVTISVVIPAYNHSRFLGEAISSVLAQTLPPAQIIVVDDGSTDDTASVLDLYRNEIQVIRQANQGVSMARNVGATVAGGEMLAFLDADDVWLPEKLERQVSRFEADPELGLVHSGVQDIDGEGNILGEHLDGLEGEVASEMLLFRRAVILGGGSGVMIPKHIFEECGGFDRRLSTSADWDLYYRIASRYRTGFIKEPLLRYRLHGANMHGNVKAMERDMLLAYRKAFNGSNAAVRHLRRQAYGNLHSVLAGSFFRAGQYGGFIRHAAKSLMLTPGNISQFARYPMRMWQRWRVADSTSKRAQEAAS